MSEPLSDGELNDFMEGLGRYMVSQDQQRADDVNALLATLTPRERSLMRDVAVMGYCRGRLHLSTEVHPKDSAVFLEVLMAIQAMPDMYPAVNRRATYLEQL
jgi:hypothetical protein